MLKFSCDHETKKCSSKPVYLQVFLVDRGIDTSSPTKPHSITQHAKMYCQEHYYKDMPENMVLITTMRIPWEYEVNPLG